MKLVNLGIAGLALLTLPVVVPICVFIAVVAAAVEPFGVDQEDSATREALS